MKARYQKSTVLLFFCLFINFKLSAQNDKIVTDKIASFSDSRLPDKLLINIKAFNSDSLKKTILLFNGSSSEVDTVFYNIGTVNYKWNIQFDSVSGSFTGKLNQTAYIKSNNSKNNNKSIENIFTVDIQEELYCCKEKPEICCVWTDRKKYPDCSTWIIKTPK